MLVKYEDRVDSVQNTKFMKIRCAMGESSLKGGQGKLCKPAFLIKILLSCLQCVHVLLHQ